MCQFCDTDFVGTDGPGGGKFAGAEAFAGAVLGAWPAGVESHRFVVCSGGELLLQLAAPLIEALPARRFRVAIETNGTQPVPPGVDWICASPKAGAPLAVELGDELKLVFPPPGAEPERFERFDFAHFFLPPMHGPEHAQYRARGRVLPGACALASELADAQADRDFLSMMELAYRFGFDAAHQVHALPRRAPESRRSRPFLPRCEVAVRGEPDPRTGFIVEFAELEQACGEIRGALDHRLLNEIAGLETPSLENLCAWVWRRLEPRFPTLARLTVRRDSAGAELQLHGRSGRFAAGVTAALACRAAA